jgi:hypothetical protein
MTLSVTTLSIMKFSTIAEHCYAECHLCRLSFMLTVPYADCHIKAPYAECHYAEWCYAECQHLLFLKDIVWSKF